MARRDALSRELLQPEASTNLALWLDRYSLGFDQEMARAHLAATLAAVRVPDGYTQAFERRKKLLSVLDGGYQGGESRRYTLSLSGRAILGIGMASVRETNLSLLRPWGVPYLAGSSLKGLASHVAHDSGSPEWARPTQPGESAGKLQQVIFGDVAAAGAVVFHDAWWIPVGDLPPVHGDTMTVHHAAYYSRQSAAPLDWEEPNPVSFLTISGSYLFALSGPAEALDIAEELLREGLKTCGIGAKTAAGYGRATLERVTSELVRKMDAHQPAAAQPNTVEHLTREFLAAVKDVSLPDEIAAAERAARRMVDASPKVWRDWLQKERCPAEAHRWFARRPEKSHVAAPVVAPPPAPSASAAPQPANEQEGVAWIALDKNNRPTLYVLLPQTKKPLEETVHKLGQAPDETTRAALASASPGAPAAVLVALRGNKRIQSVRLKPS